MSADGSAQGPARLQGRLDSIDGLRAVAALLVIWHHVAESFRRVAGSAFWVHDAAVTIYAGTIGVSLFFLISGFLIPASLREGSQGRTAVLRAFAIRRFFRLYPLYWLSVPFGFLTFWIFLDRSPDLATVLANLTMIPGLLGYEFAEGLYWTLAFELIFYLLCAGLFAAGLLQRRWGLMVTFTTLVALYAAARASIENPPHNGVIALPTPAQLLSILALMILGALWRDWNDNRANARWARWSAPVATALWIGAIVGSRIHIPLVGPGLRITYALAIGIFLSGVFWLPIRSGLMAWLGRISYSLYLFHPVVFYIALLKIADQPALPFVRGWPLWAYVLLCGALTIGVSALLYRFVEAPAMALGARLSRGDRVAPPVHADVKVA